MKASKVEETSSAACVIGCSDDLLPQILIHLPARSLLRFKLVSKQWMFLISGPQFVIKHIRNTHSQAPCGLFLYHRLRTSTLRMETVFVPLFGNPLGSVPSPLFLDKLPRNFVYFERVIQSCNGLLLCIFYKDINYDYRCIVCNPTTRKFKVLPRCPDLGRIEWLDGLTLVFNPSESHHYKVVGIRRYGWLCWSELGACELHIYSSETNCWKFRRYIDGLEPNTLHRGAFSNGTVYWIGRNKMHYYNVISEEVGHPDMPVIPSVDPWMKLHGDWSFNYFAESCGRLYFVADTDYRNVFQFDSSRMRWSNPNVELLKSENFENASLLAMAKGEDRDFVLLFATYSRLIISNLALPRQVVALEIPKMYDFNACEYIPSVAPV